MGYEGHDDSRDVASEQKKHPWEVFPEDDSTERDGKKKRVKTEEQRQKEKERREKRKARINSAKAWVMKNKVLSVGIVLVIIVLIVGGVILVVNLVRDKGQLSGGSEGVVWESIDLSQEIAVEDAVTPDYGYTLAVEKLRQAAEEGLYNNSGEFDESKYEDTMDAYIRDKVSEEDKPAYELSKIVLLTTSGAVSRAKVLLDKFDEQNLTVGKNTRYIYLMTKAVYYGAVENSSEEAKWRGMLDEEYPPERNYVDYDTGELITDEGEIEKIRTDLERLKSGLYDSESDEEEEE